MVIVKEEEKVKEKVKEKDTGDIFEYSLQEQIEEKLLELDSRYLDEQKIKWPHLDFNFEYQTFCEKVRGSPEFYKDHSEGGIRLAFQKQLRDKKINGTSGNRKQQHTSKLAQSVAETYRNVFTGGGNGEGGKPPA